MDREARPAAIHGVAKSRTRLSDWTELNWGLYQNWEKCTDFPYAFWPHMCIAPLLSVLLTRMILLLLLLNKGRTYTDHPESIVYFLVYSWYCVFCGFGQVYNKQMGFPHGASGKEPACQCSRCKRREFDPWVGKIPWRKAWQPTPVFLPGESRGQRSLVGSGP